MLVMVIKKDIDMTDISRFFRLPLGFNELSGANNPMIGLLGAASLGLSVGSSLFGGLKSRKAAKRALAEQKYRTNAEKAWYDKEYNTDYLDTKAGQNLMRRAQEVQDNYIRKADGAAAGGGGTAASTAMAKEAANRTMGNTIANIGANDTARKASVSDQHMRNEQSLSKQREDIYNQQAANTAEAAQNMSNAMMSAASALDGTPKASKPGKVDVSSPQAKAAMGGSVVPKINENEVLYSQYSDKLKNVTGV